MTFTRCLPAALILVALQASCATDTHGDGDLGVSAVQFQDVVVPDGMKLVDDYHESHSKEEAGWRFGHFVYVGQPQVQDACSHLLLRMPQHLWTLAADDTPSEGTRTLRFERGRYVAKYTLQRIDGVTHMVIDYDTNIESR